MIWILVAAVVFAVSPNKPKEIVENKEVITQEIAESNENSVSKQ